MSLSICTIAHDNKVIEYEAELRIAAADKFLFIRKPLCKLDKSEKESVSTQSRYAFFVSRFIFSVLQSGYTIFFLELAHEMINVIVSALLSNLLNTKFSVSKEPHCFVHSIENNIILNAGEKFSLYSLWR